MVEVAVGVELEGERSKQRSYCDPEMTRPHHWIIESANGLTSSGKCKLCDEVRSFKNSDIADWRFGRSEKLINLPFDFQFERDDDV